VTWGNLPGKPEVFPPAAHHHDQSYYQKGEVDTLIADAIAAIDFPENPGGGSSGPVSWNDVQNKPATFAPSAHSHDVATQSAAGFLSASDKTKLDNVPADFPAFIGTSLVEGTGIAISYDAQTGKTTITNVGAGSGGGEGGAVDWASITGKPTSFPPAAHTHNWTSITDKPTSFTPAAHSHLWADITDKPTSFAPSAHTHLWAHITDKPTTFAPSAHTHTWAEISDKPATFPPSAHAHSYNDLTDKPASFPPSAHSHDGLAPAGGTTGQVLKKVSGTNFDYAWADDATGGGAGTAAGTSFAPNGTIAATNVQDAIVEVRNEAAPVLHDHNDLYDTKAQVDAKVGAVGAGSLVATAYLTLQQDVPIPTADIAGAATVWMGALGINALPIYSVASSAFIARTFGTSVSLTLNNPNHAANTNYDVFAIWSGGNVILVTAPAWANTTNRTFGIQLLQGRVVNATAFTGRNGATTYTVGQYEATLIGTIRTTSAGMTEDSRKRRFVSQALNPFVKAIGWEFTDTTWSYNSTTFRQVNGNSFHQVEVIQSLAGRLIDVTYNGCAFNNTVVLGVGIGIDATNQDNCTMKMQINPGATTSYPEPGWARYAGGVPLGYHYYAALENGSGSAYVPTWQGAFTNSRMKLGMHGFVLV
jgi:hypothetical protein